MAKLSLYVFGAPQIILRGSAVEPDTRKATALLVYLAITGQPHTRDALATLLWPEFDQRRSRAALRRTISSLKSALDGYGLVVERDSLALNPSADIWTDVLQFRLLTEHCRSQQGSIESICHSCLNDLIAAAELYRNDFLAGFTLRDSASFDEWQYSQSESLHLEITNTLQTIAECLRSLGNYEQAIQYANRLLQMDPLHEPAHRQLMVLFALNDRRTLALRQYRECVRILEEELGVPPLPATTDLYEQILRGELMGEGKSRISVHSDQPLTHLPAPDPYPVGASVETGIASHIDKMRAMPPPMVGRKREWEQLLAAYEAIDDGQLIILEGEVGIGKTRLSQAFAEYLMSHGAKVITTQCFEGEAKLAYGPFIEGIRYAVRSSLQENWFEQLSPYILAEASRLVPELRYLVPALPILPALDNPGARSRYYEAVSQLLLAICHGPKPGLLIVDDLHWADEATLDLLSYIVRRLKGRTFNVLVTWRDDLVDRHHRLRQLYVQTSRSGYAQLIQLKRLGSDAVQKLVQATITLPKVDEISEYLYRETEGIPFFVVEYLEIVKVAEGDTGQLNAFTKDHSLPMPRGVQNLLLSRVSNVSETAYQLLHTASVIGRSFDYEILRQASGRTEEETVNGLEELLAKGLIAELPDEPITSPDTGLPNWDEPRYDFTHEKLRSFIYQDTSLARRRLLHRRVATAIVERSMVNAGKGSRLLLAARVAHHFQLGGLDKEAAEYHKIAGDAAGELYANMEALSHYQAALALGYPDTASLYEALGDLNTIQAEYTNALTHYDAAAAVIEKEEGRGNKLGHLEQKIGVVYHRMGEWELATHHYGLALAQVQDKVLRARLMSDWSLTAHQQGDSLHAAELANKALELATELDDLAGLAQAHNILGILASSRSELPAANDHLEQSIELARANGLPAVQVAAMNNLALAYRSSGMMNQALELTQSALSICQELGDRHREAALHNNIADLFHATGRSEDAMAHLKQAAAMYAEIGSEGAVNDWRPEIWKLTEW